jgi:thymidylate kinase
MIVEFIGSTGAGKTTLIAEVERSLREGGHPAPGTELATNLFGLRRVTHPTLRNLIQDVRGIPSFAGALPRHHEFCAFALSMLARHKRGRLVTANYIRSIIRKIGTYEFVKRRGRDRVVLVDEGTLLAAHLLFVFTGAEPGDADIETFARLVPLPDLVVYITAPIDRLVERALRRTDVRREMRSGDRRLVERHVRHAAQTFDRLVETDVLRDRVLVIDNSDSTSSERRIKADHIAAVIHQYRPEHESALLAVGEARPAL